jgi:hypothetical protein
VWRLFLPRIEALLLRVPGGPWNRHLETVNQYAVSLLDCQCRASMANAFLRRGAVGRELLAQQRHDLTKEVFAKTSAQPEEVPDHFVRHVVPRVDQTSKSSCAGTSLRFAPPPTAR